MQPTDTPILSRARPHLFGRRKGRPLRALRAELMDTLLPNIKVTPENVFITIAGAKDVWLEVGFGGGEHMVEQARLHPDVMLLGSEPFINGVGSALKLIDESAVHNVRVFPDDARLLLDALPDNSLGKCFVLFADPWPKKRHHERRFIGRENLDRLARVLRCGAELRLASDHPSLIEWMLEHASNHPNFKPCFGDLGVVTDRPNDWPQTRYEQKAIIAGRNPVWASYVRQ